MPDGFQRRAEVAAGVPLLPPNQSISFSLIEALVRCRRRTAGRRTARCGQIVGGRVPGRNIADRAAALSTLAFRARRRVFFRRVRRIPLSVGGAALISGSERFWRDTRNIAPQERARHEQGWAASAGTGSAVIPLLARFVRIPWRSLLPAAGLALLGPRWPGASLVSRVPAPPYSVPFGARHAGRESAGLRAVAARISAGGSTGPGRLEPARRNHPRIGGAISAIGLYDGFLRSPAPEPSGCCCSYGCHGFDFLNAIRGRPRLINVRDQCRGPWCISGVPCRTSTGQWGCAWAFCSGVGQHRRHQNRRDATGPVFGENCFSSPWCPRSSRKTALGWVFDSARNLSGLAFPPCYRKPCRRTFFQLKLGAAVPSAPALIRQPSRPVSPTDGRPQ